MMHGHHDHFHEGTESEGSIVDGWLDVLAVGSFSALNKPFTKHGEKASLCFYTALVFVLINRHLCLCDCSLANNLALWPSLPNMFTSDQKKHDEQNMEVWKCKELALYFTVEPGLGRQPRVALLFLFLNGGWHLDHHPAVVKTRDVRSILF